jgi:hypothetical protein
MERHAAELLRDALALPVEARAALIDSLMRIPSDADQRSELMAITIPNSCRSPFQSDGDHCSKPMPITRPVG